MKNLDMASTAWPTNFTLPTADLALLNKDIKAKKVRRNYETFTTGTEREPPEGAPSSSCQEKILLLCGAAVPPAY